MKTKTYENIMKEYEKSGFKLIMYRDVSEHDFTYAWLLLDGDKKKSIKVKKSLEVGIYKNGKISLIREYKYNMNRWIETGNDYETKYEYDELECMTHMTREILFWKNGNIKLDLRFGKKEGEKQRYTRIGIPTKQFGWGENGQSLNDDEILELREKEFEGLDERCNELRRKGIDVSTSVLLKPIHEKFEEQIKDWKQEQKEEDYIVEDYYDEGKIEAVKKKEEKNIKDRLRNDKKII